jgi:hypothetical protein
MSRRDGPFQILENINDNAYKIDLSGEYGVSATFNIFYLYLFDVGDDLRFSPFDERKDNAIQTTPNNSLEVLVGSITRSRSKKLKDTFNELIQNI